MHGFVIIYVLGVPSRPQSRHPGRSSPPLVMAAEPATLSLCDTFCAPPRGILVQTMRESRSVSRTLNKARRRK